jgi:hypothetical protein
MYLRKIKIFPRFQLKNAPCCAPMRKTLHLGQVLWRHMVCLQKGAIVMSISPAQLAANQANAQLSTGPRTEAGKARSSQNAIKHGLFSRQLLLPGEDPNALASFRSSVLKRLAPRDLLELQVVEQYISSSWKLRRLEAAEQEAYLDEAEVMSLELSESLGDSKDLPQPSVGLLTWRLMEDGKLERLSRHQQRLWNQMQKCLKQLAELKRQPAEQEDLEAAAIVQNEPSEGAGSGNSSGEEDLYHALRREQQVMRRKEMLEAQQKAAQEATSAVKVAEPAPKSAA